MKPRTLGIIFFCLILLACVPLLLKYLEISSQFSPEAAAALPFQPSFSVTRAGSATVGAKEFVYWKLKAGVRTYGGRGAVLMDIGDIRIAIRDWSKRSTSSTRVRIDTNAPPEWKSGSTSSGGSHDFSFRAQEVGLTTEIKVESSRGIVQLVLADR